MGETVIGVILAGGLARRMGGGDKCLQALGGRPILRHILDRFAPQVDQVILNANGAPERFSEFGLPVVGDVVAGFSGPLAGVLTGMEWAAANRPDVEWIVTVPGDGPFLPVDLVSRFLQAVHGDQARMAVACSNGRSQPVVGLWPVALRDDLRRALVEEEIRKVDLWTAAYRLVEVDFDSRPIDPFFNTNRPDDLARAEAFLNGMSD